MKRTLLIADDSAINRALMKKTLGGEYEILEAENGRVAIEIVRRSGKLLSALLLDIIMPEKTGYDVLRWVRETPQFSQLPVIMVTGSEDEASRVKALSFGANDFILKPFNPEIVKHCIKNNIAMRETVSVLNAIQRDKLTGLYNRSAFFDRVGEMVPAKEPGHYIMACFDVDKFKVINDQYGTEKGDEVLKHIASVFNTGFAPNGGACCRVSEDNFAVLYPTGFQNSQEIEEIRRRASHMEGIVTPIIFSIGRYVIDDVTMPPAAMYDRAMLAAASVKGRYDNKIAFYDETMRQYLLREQEIVTEMESALRERQFEVWFQPQYNHATDAMIGAEALVRWRHPQKGLIPPGDFVPVFEQNGFIYSMDKYVWEETCRYLRKWLDEGRRPLPVSVNISRYDVFRPDLVDTVAGLVEKYQLPMELLRLEITESAFAEAAQRIVDVVKELIARGFTVEIDDFGSGYSSLNTLKDVPAQIIKLDMKFLENSNDSRRGGNILESVVRMTKWLGMSVIAEGVETLEQANYLRSIGCSYVQGYLYARPMDVGKYETYCTGSDKEERLLTLQTVENLDNNAFWDPNSMDTLIFNSFVGGACIYEYHQGNIELLRATEKYAQVIGNADMTVEEVLKLNLTEHLDEENRARVIASLEESVATRSEVTGEYVFRDLPGCPQETYLRSTMRVIASTGERYLVYCTNENITEQRKAEQREKETAERLRAIMRNMDGGVTATVIHQGNLRPLFANDRYYEILGYTQTQYAEAFNGMPNCILPEDREMVMKRCNAVSATGEPDCIEYRIRHTDGTIRWLRSNVTLMDYPGETEPVQLSVSYDITGQLEAQNEIQSLSERLQAIMRDSGCGITAAVLDGDGSIKLLFANDRFYEIHGYTRQQYEAEVKDKYVCIHPDDREKARQDTIHAYVTQTPAHLQYRLIRPDGTVCWVRVDLSSTRFTGVHQNVHLCIFTDITSEKLAEQATRDASAQLRSVMGDMPGGFVRMQVVSPGLVKPLYFNDGFCRLVSMTPEEVWALYGNNVIDGVHPDDVQLVRGVVAQIYQQGEAYSPRYRLRSGKGGYVWLSIFGRVTQGASGETFLNFYYMNATRQVEEEETQKELLDNLPGGAGIYEYNAGALSVVYLNKSYWTLMGREPSSYAGLLPMSAVHPDDMETITRELAAAIEQRRDLVCDIRLRHETEGYRPVHLVGRIVPKEKNRVTIFTTFALIGSGERSYQHTLPLLLSAMMDATTDLAFAKDRDFRYLSASLAFAKMAGQDSVQQVIGKTDFDLFPRQLANKYRHDDEEMMKTGVALVDMVELIPSADGTPHYSSTSKYLLRDGSGQVIGLYGTGRDVTKAVEQDSRLKLVNDSIPGGLATYVCTPGDFSPRHIKLTYFNDGFCRLFGYAREEYESLAAVDPTSMIFREDRRIVSEQWLALMERGTPINCLYRVHVKDGGYKWISHRAVAADRQNEQVLVNAILQDVTDQRELIEQLRISEEENSLAVQLGGNIICRYLVADRSLTMAPEAAAAYSLPETVADVPYGPVRLGMISPESEKAYIGFFEAILHGSSAATATFQQKYFGTWRWMEAKSSTIFSDDGKPVKAVISFYDVTERLESETIYKKWQQSLMERRPESFTLFHCNLNNDASYAVAGGTLLHFDFDHAGRDFNERARAYIQQCVLPDDRDRYTAFANADALLANYYRGKRSGVLEYRERMPDGRARWLRLTVDLVESPNSTEVEAYLMYENIDEAKRAELKTKALSETDPLTGVLNRTTFAARVDQRIRASGPAARHALIMLDIDGFKQVNDVFGHGAGDQALFDIADGLCSIMRHNDLVARLGGDEFLVFLSDVLDDVSVANKAKQICALARKSFSMEVRISASVGVAAVPRDGMNFETLYKKADAALYYVKGSGKNSFAFYGDHMSDQHLEPEADGENPARRAEKKRRMLVVDDNVIDHELLHSIFQDEFIVEKAKDGNSALVRLRHYGSAISVVLLDLMMPGMDGFAVLEKMQASAELQTIPVIIVSGDESRDTCLKAIRKGATDFITKPVDAELLRLRVHSAISRAENERLRAKNCLLEVQNEERIRYESALDSLGVTFVEYNWHTGGFIYYPSMSRYVAGTYDSRTLWRILLADMVADTLTVQEMQHLVHRVAEDRALMSDGMTARLKTPGGEMHRFRINVRKLVNDYQLTNKLIIALNDLEYANGPNR